MSSLTVLFEQPPNLARVAESLAKTGQLQTPAETSRSHFDPRSRPYQLLTEDLRIEVTIVSEPVSAALLEESIFQAAGTRLQPPRAHAAQATVRVLSDENAVRGKALILREMVAATKVAGALLSVPDALALLDREGRVLSDPEAVARRLSGRSSTPPLDLWVSVRSFELEDARGWFFDTLGMGQLALPDLEAYTSDGPDASRMAAWLRMVCLHLAQEAAPLRTGDTLDGPDDAAWVTAEDDATVEPARSVLRFAPSRIQ